MRPKEPELVIQIVLNNNKTVQLSHQEIKVYLAGFFCCSLHFGDCYRVAFVLMSFFSHAIWFSPSC